MGGSHQAQTISYTSMIPYSKINGSLVYKAQQPSEFLYRNNTRARNVSSNSGTTTIPAENTSFVTKLISEDQKVFDRYKESSIEKDTLIPDSLFTLTLQELGYVETDFDPSILQIIREIAKIMTMNTLTFSVSCAKKTNRCGLDVKEIVFYLKGSYGIFIPDFDDQK